MITQLDINVVDIQMRSEQRTISMNDGKNVNIFVYLQLQDVRSDTSDIGSD